MKLEEILESTAGTVREVKSRAVRLGRGVRGECDVRPAILVYRGDEQVVLAQAPNRDESLQVAKFAASGYDADVLVHISDSWKASDANAAINPVTGNPWQPGDMGRAVEDHGALEKGWITECCFLVAMNRAGDMLAMCMAYRVVKRHVEWEPTALMRDGEGGHNTEGLIPDTLREAMAMPGFSSVMNGLGATYDSFNMRDEEGRARQDVMVTKMIGKEVPTVTIAMMIPAGGLREAVVREWLPEAEVLRPPPRRER